MNRCWAKIENHNTTLLSREGKLISGFDDIEKELSDLEDQILDGELIADDGETSLEKFRNTQKIVRKKIKNKKGVSFNVYDIVNKDIYKHRREDIETIFNDNKFDNIKNVKVLYQGPFSKEIVEKYYKEALDNLEEGIMINTLDGLYKCSKNRTQDLLKYKTFKDVDLKVIDVAEGEGELKGSLGAIVVSYKGFKVKVGSGFNDSDRSFYWKNKDKILKKVVRVKYFEESTNEKGELSLRLPIFVDVLDKEIESYF